MNERRKILESDSSADDDLLLQKGKSAMRKIKRKAVSTARVPLVKRGKERGGKGMVKDGQLPSTSRKMGSTRQYPSFAIESSPFLTHLHAFSSSRFGLGMQLDAATELVVDVSKYLYFAGEGEQDCNNLYCTEKAMMKYLVKLEEDGIQPSGQLTKLQRIESALKFASLDDKWCRIDTGEAVNILNTFSRWKKRLQAEKTAKSKMNRPLVSEQLKSFTEYSEVLALSKPLQRVKEALDCHDPAPTAFNAAVAYIALHFFIKCKQRKSAIENLCINEYEGAVKGDCIGYNRVQKASVLMAMQG